MDYDISARQHDYYANALKWLGVVEDADGKLKLSTTGKRLFALSEMRCLLEMAKIAFSNDIFNLFLNANEPVIDMALRRRNDLETDSTFTRRMQTVKSWKAYFFQKLNAANT